jgi:hypothetical protein
VLSITTSCFLISSVCSPASVYSCTSCLLSLHVFVACKIFHVLRYFIAGSRRCVELNLLLAGVTSSGRQCCCARTHLSHIITRAHLLLGRRFIALLCSWWTVSLLLTCAQPPSPIAYRLDLRNFSKCEFRRNFGVWGRHPLYFNHSKLEMQLTIKICNFFFHFLPGCC